jgi:hypothetical protein
MTGQLFNVSYNAYIRVECNKNICICQSVPIKAKKKRICIKEYVFICHTRITSRCVKAYYSLSTLQYARNVGMTQWRGTVLDSFKTCQIASFFPLLA